MGFLEQLSCSVTNSPKMILSMWVIMRGTGPQFTQLFAGPLFTISYSADDTGGSFGCDFIGIEGSINADDCFSGDATNPYVSPPSAGTYTPRTLFSFDGGAACANNTKFHLGLSFDLTTATTPGITYDPMDQTVVATSGIVTASINGVLKATSSEPDSTLVGRGGNGMVLSIAQKVGGGGIISPRYGPEIGLIGASSTFVPGWSFSILGFPIGIPETGADGGPTTAVVMGDVMIWVGQYQNMANSTALFLSGGPAVAIAALGTPTYHFSGNSTDFLDNQGTGGPFTKTGSVTDYP